MRHGRGHRPASARSGGIVLTPRELLVLDRIESDPARDHQLVRAPACRRLRDTTAGVVLWATSWALVVPLLVRIAVLTRTGGRR
ncbi:hypothetical protein [Kitasatospora purpeofusca]|uniref:hypothetical protein n=1 Tax=Kitasatospora purpeofusca TaxID=67352 RepID=UPI002A5A01F0|nr:hypothetical protein [Kitasatospora purpeofusca]MDY0810632.1 hypothetical protein [Kitasatospora purpeofusca]